MSSRNVAGGPAEEARVIEVITQFLKVYVDPIIADSPIISQRRVFRSSKRLNELFYHNREALNLIYNEAKRWDPYNVDGKLGFTVRSARELFY